MPSPVVTFAFFVIFLLCQYSIWVVSNFISHYFGLTGRLYWCMVCVCFLLLNEFCFGAYDFSTNLLEDEDEWLNEWDGE